ncbi:uncharacterized protein LOC112623103 [Theropithecus gelada]|uniref:uncharacterized protein LOC112623103 n=1 Tax=Theropithecus gelada TaxID=9565 RepID=UPI000DC17291|nr:uncharacterized protein LOC112623103 [Theropithecus gelada]
MLPTLCVVSVLQLVVGVRRLRSKRLLRQCLAPHTEQSMISSSLSGRVPVILGNLMGAGAAIRRVGFSLILPTSPSPAHSGSAPSAGPARGVSGVLGRRRPVSGAYRAPGPRWVLLEVLESGNTVSSKETGERVAGGLAAGRVRRYLHGWEAEWRGVERAPSTCLTGGPA